MIITIGGMSGSYKNKVARIISERLGSKHCSIGNIRKKLAVERNITLEDLNYIGEKQEFTDKQADEQSILIGKKKGSFVVDGRLAYHSIPKSIKVLLKAHLRIRADRVYIEEKDMEGFRDIGDAMAALINREKSDQYRFNKYYDLNCNDELKYDLVINTDYLSDNEVAEQIVEFLKKENMLKELI